MNIVQLTNLNSKQNGSTVMSDILVREVFHIFQGYFKDIFKEHYIGIIL